MTASVEAIARRRRIWNVALLVALCLTVYACQTSEGRLIANAERLRFAMIDLAVRDPESAFFCVNSNPDVSSGLRDGGALVFARNHGLKFVDDPSLNTFAESRWQFLIVRLSGEFENITLDRDLSTAMIGNTLHESERCWLKKDFSYKHSVTEDGMLFEFPL